MAEKEWGWVRNAELLKGGETALSLPSHAYWQIDCVVDQIHCNIGPAVEYGKCANLSTFFLFFFRRSFRVAG
jgi:hypothetical protein